MEKNIFQYFRSLVLAVPLVTVTLPHVVIGAIKRIRNATLLKRPDDCTYYEQFCQDVEGRNGAEREGQEAHSAEDYRGIKGKRLCWG